jgi:hypothetical protein
MKTNKYILLMNNYINYIIRLKELKRAYYTPLSNYFTIVSYLNHFNKNKDIIRLIKLMKMIINDNNLYNSYDLKKCNKMIINLCFTIE